jgi:hypothetical protein
LQKKTLTPKEKYGLSNDHVAEAERYLKKNKTTGILNKHDAMPMYELYILGYSFEDISRRYPSIPLGKILLTAALNQWPRDRETVAASLYDRIRTRIIKSTVEQVEFLTDIISVSNVETSEEIKKYLLDPVNNPPPSFRIKTIKDYQQVIDMLAQVAESVKGMSNPSNVSQDNKSLTDNKIKKINKKQSASSEEAVILAELVGDVGE